MTTNDYGDLIDRWKVDLIVERARRRGLRTQSLDDAVQEIVLVLLDFKFDVNKANGASARTVLTSVIDQCLKMLRRGERRYEKRIEKVGRRMGITSEADQPPPRVRVPLNTATLKHDADDQASLELDCAALVESLPANSQLVCRRLAAGCSVLELAKELGCDWHTAQKRVAATREQFERKGMDVWLKAI